MGLVRALWGLVGLVVAVGALLGACRGFGVGRELAGTSEPQKACEGV